MNLDSGKTFKWTDQTIPLPALKSVMEKWQTGMHGKGWKTQFRDNHDQPRMLSRLGGIGILPKGWQFVCI